MGPFTTIFSADLGNMVRSWVVWIWITVTVLAGGTAIGVSVSYIDETSFIFSWALFLYVAMGSFVVMAIGASATSADLSYLGNAIISRGVNPVQYVTAKILSRFVTVVVCFVAVVLPIGFLLMVQGGNNDMTTEGVLIGLGYVLLLLSILVMLAVTFSTLISNILLSFSLLGIIWYSALGAFVSLRAPTFTADGLLGDLPSVLQGAVDINSHLMNLGYLCIPLILLPALAILFFGNRDL